MDTFPPTRWVFLIHDPIVLVVLWYNIGPLLKKCCLVPPSLHKFCFSFYCLTVNIERHQITWTLSTKEPLISGYIEIGLFVLWSHKTFCLNNTVNLQTWLMWDTLEIRHKVKSTLMSGELLLLVQLNEVSLNPLHIILWTIFEKVSHYPIKPWMGEGVKL